MHVFRDTLNRSWTIEIDVAALKRVRQLCNVHLAGLFDEGMKPLARLLGDVALFVDVLYALLQEQVQRAGISDIDFARGLRGDTLGQATEMFVQELIDFFPHEKRRNFLGNVMTKCKQVEEARIEKMQQELAELSVEEMLSAPMPAEPAPSSDTSGASPASSASTPPG